VIRRLLLLNGLAVVAAVVQHATGWGYTSLFWWTNRYSTAVPPDFSHLGSASYYALRVAEQLTIFAPPAFLFVSGVFVAFAAGRAGLGYGWEKAAGRIRMLVIPYAAWSVAIFAVRAAEGAVEQPAGYVTKLLVGGAADPYYYVPLVVQFYLLAPVVVPLLKERWKTLLIAAAVIQVGAQAARYSLILGWKLPAADWIVGHSPGWFVPVTALWFVSGVAAGFHWTAVMQWLARWRPVLPWATAGFAALGVLEWELLLRGSGRQWLPPGPTVIDTFYSGSLILTFLAFAHVEFPAQDELNRLGERSFGIYLMHAPVLELLARLTYHAAPAILAEQWLFQSLLVAAGLALPLLFMAAVNRSPARPVYNYVFG
jgi:surface polysaccharide O-acyltransferase-like enzyme